MNPAAILALISDLYDQIQRLGAERDEIAAQCADLRRHLDECPANQEPAPPAQSARPARKKRTAA